MLKLFVSLQNRLAGLRNEEGQTMAEYGVVLAVITLVIVARCSPFGCDQRRTGQGRQRPE